ncbi:MAG: response regulator [Bacteroidota bacterium]|nr:response regulator [Bacteroidota bacterium]
MTTIGIIDDTDVLRQSMQLLLENSSRLRVVFSLHNARSLLAQTEAFMPRLLLMDIDMPGVKDIEAVKMVKRDFPAVDVVIPQCNGGCQRIPVKKDPPG